MVLKLLQVLLHCYVLHIKIDITRLAIMNGRIENLIPYPPWVRIKEATRLFAVGRDTLYKWRSEGLIKTADTSGSGKNTVYRSSDIDRILNEISEGRIPARHDKYFGRQR